MATVNCCQKCGLSLNQTNDDEDATELHIAKNDWGQLKAGASFSFQEYVSCDDDDDVMSEVQTLKEMMNKNVGFEVFTVVVMKSIIFWDMTPCSPLSCTRRFGGTHLLATCLLAGLLN
jgi:hypothetical protein